MENIKELTSAEMISIAGGQACPPLPNITLTEQQKFSMLLDAQLYGILDEISFYYENFDWFE